MLPPGVYTFPDGWLEYYLHGVLQPRANISGDYQVEVVVGTPITGLTREVNCDILPNVTIELLKAGVPKGSAISDGSGNYIVMAPESGAYEVVASKSGFRNETQEIEVESGHEYSLNFTGDHGLIPNAPSMPYALQCVNYWLYPQPPYCGLSMPKALAVVNAWLYPIVE